MSSCDPAAPHCDSLEEELEDMEQKQSEVIDLEEKERHLDWLQKRARELSNELSAARATLRRRAAEAVLPVIQPREPCTAPWEQMKGDDRVRRCSRCKNRVYDLSALPAEEARRLIAKHEGQLPTHVFARVDGTVTTGQCQQAQRRKRSPLLIGLSALAGLLLLGTALGSGLVMGYNLRPRPGPALVSDLARVSRPEPPEHRAESTRPRERDRHAPRRRTHGHHHVGPSCRGGWYSEGPGWSFYFGDGDRSGCFEDHQRER